jgi:hypothetical protein
MCFHVTTIGTQFLAQNRGKPWVEGPQVMKLTILVTLILEKKNRHSVVKNDFAMYKVVAKSYFWIQFTHFRYQTSHFTVIDDGPYAQTLVQSVHHNPFSRKYLSVTQNVSSPIARRKEAARVFVSIRCLKCLGCHSWNCFPQNFSEGTWHVINSVT